MFILTSRAAALLLVLLAPLLPGVSGDARAQDAPLTIVLQRGGSETSIGEALRAAAALGRPLRIEWHDGAAASTTAAPAPERPASSPAAVDDTEKSPLPWMPSPPPIPASRPRA